LGVAFGKPQSANANYFPRIITGTFICLAPNMHREGRRLTQRYTPFSPPAGIAAREIKGEKCVELVVEQRAAGP